MRVCVHPHQRFIINHEDFKMTKYPAFLLKTKLYVVEGSYEIQHFHLNTHYYFAFINVCFKKINRACMNFTSGKY